MRKRSMFRLLAAVILGAALAVAGSARAELVVIVSARNPVTAMRADQVADIFLGQSGSFPDGSEAVAVDQGVGSPLRDAFYEKFTSKSPALVKAYWTKMIFTGRGQPPRELPGNAAIRRRVADNPSLIGYVDRSAVDATVRVVQIVR